jgi:CheY-like chemotaxis protein
MSEIPLAEDLRKFDLLLSDIRMPGQLDGIALAEPALSRQPTLPVLLQTAFYDNKPTQFPKLK